MLWMLWIPVALALPRAECLSCLPGGDESRGLLLRDNDDTALELQWRGTAPGLGDGRVHIFAGNPSLDAALPDRGVINPSPDGSVRARISVPAPQVGSGTFIAALVRVDRRGDPEQILSWEVFRLLTLAEAEAQSRGPSPHTGWELDLSPSVLRAQRGGQSLPRGEGEETVWWSLVGRDLRDLDLDGASTGLPGLSVHVSAPWRSRTKDLKDRLREILDETGGHKARFAEDFTWIEREDRDLPQEGLRARLLHFYAVVTLHTNAGQRGFEARDLLEGLGLGERSYFSHETSANLDNPPDPRLWAGYSERELSEDPRLLRLLGRQIRDGDSIEGLPPGLGQGDGDGGSPSWELGFIARIQDWSKVVGSPKDRAVIEAVDVVASRVGLSIPSAVGRADEPGLVGELKGWFEAADVSHTMNLAQPPQGWRLAMPVAERSTKLGTLRLEHGKPSLAQRTGIISASSLFPAITAQAVAAKAQAMPAPEDPESLQAQARFVLGAELRAGALAREATVQGRTRTLVPVDTWAQIALQITVRIEGDAELVVAGGPNVETDPGQGVQIVAPPKPPGVMDKLAGALGVSRGVLGVGLGVIAVGVLLVLVQMTGLGPALNRVLMLILPRPKGPKEP